MHSLVDERSAKGVEMVSLRRR